MVLNFGRVKRACLRTRIQSKLGANLELKMVILEHGLINSTSTLILLLLLFTLHLGFPSCLKTILCLFLVLS